MKKGFAGIVFILFIIAGIGITGGTYFIGKQVASRTQKQPEIITAPSTPTSTSTLAPTVDEKSMIIQDIRQALAAEHGTDANSYNITVSKIVGDYASGGTSGSGGGGMWFTAKTNGVWKIVWAGNGIILCSDLTAYPNYPSSLISECYNDKTQKTVKR